MRAMVEAEKILLVKDLGTTKIELDIARKELGKVAKVNDDHVSKLSLIDGQA